MNIQLPTDIYGQNKNLTLDTNKRVHTFIGPNGSGKSKLMQAIKNTIGPDKVKIIAGNINSIPTISAIDEDQTKRDSLNHNDIDNIISLINANETIRKIVFHWFEKLFNKRLSKDGNMYQVKEDGFTYNLNVDGDGYKSFFNLVYYLTTPDYKIIVFDEPERFLHPNLQISLFNMVKKLSKDYGKRIFFITHNNNFIDLLSDDIEVFLMNKSKQEVFNVTQKVNATNNKQFKTWIHYNKSILFSKAIVLLEGYSDQILLNHLMSKLNHSAFARNITFASVAIVKENGGKTRIPEYQKIISQFFDCWALFDLDLLLDTGGELAKYITDPSQLNPFKANLTGSGITNKATLKAFYNTPANSIAFINQMIDELRQNHKVLVLKKGEMEDYCTSIGTNKLSDRLYDEVDHISVTANNVIETQYRDLIRVFEQVDNIGNLNNSEFENLIFQFVNKFYTEYYTTTAYNWTEISEDVRNHIMNDPNQAGDSNFRFIFKFLSDKEFTLGKELSDKQKKELIKGTLQN